MKKILKWVCCFFLLCSLFPASLIAQKYLDPNGIIRSEIVNLVQSRYGKQFQYVGYSMLDSLIHYSTKEKEYRTQDPFNTLKGCVLFSAYKGHRTSGPDTFIVGMVKNGAIVWDNAPGMSADLGGELLYAQDMNDDGEVDLIFSELDMRDLRITGKPPLQYYLYVLSWDGKRGKLINAFSKKGKSIMLSDGGCELVADKKGSKVLEIETRLPNVDFLPKNYRTSAYPLIRYTWNGKRYGLWPETIPKNKTQQKN